ncbi:aminodeoxychorismate synthase component I [Allokutzneria sp. NRRL B-24872]|uniref:aminodeoxychorismate synthase component I n=1 Tax=Allokutzneria sp. NRRL B-24872 TaxID=1137961 RepID=UPI000A36C7F3|nr:aminodeoxychorismate synthase component I [Allokutzneria sp. NRRL B-24872]
MRVVAWPLASDTAPERVFRRLSERASVLGIAPPAALVGDWFGSRAVLAPTLSAEPVDDVEAFAFPGQQPSVAVTSAPADAIGGGWFGYLGYGLTDPGVWERPRRLPNAVWGWADHVLRQDRRGRWWFEALVPDGQPAPDQLATELIALVDRGEDPPVRPWVVDRLARPSAELHMDAVRACVDSIGEGEIFQANVCSEFSAVFAGDPAEVYAAGVGRLRPTRSAYLAGEWGALSSFSPELFLSRRGNIVRSSPIKGTLPRRLPEHNGNALLLRQSAKDVAENVMIVDLVRNDLGRVCATGSVTVPELLSVRPAPGVWHLVSTVEGQLPSTVDDDELLAAAFPPGSVTGAPKLRALEIVAELEASPREAYCGAIGLASPVAGMELNVVIRTLEFHGDTVRLGVGGGITADSDPAAEWQECLTKAAPIETLLATPLPTALR